MSIRKYIAYLRTVETGSITQAANELGYTQSAVSKMISDLEQDWQVKLLTRNHSGIEISSDGMVLLPTIREIVKDYEDLNFAVSELHGVQSGTLRLGCFTSLAISLLPEILKDFHQTYPNIQIQLMTGEYYEISEWLRRGAIDCGFLAIPASNDFETTTILHDTMVAILPKDHPMADASVFPLEQLPHENFVRLMEIEDYEFNRLLDHYNIHPEVTYDTTSDFALLSMVEAGLGISIVHSLLIKPGRYRVATLPLNVKQSREIGIAVKRAFSPPRSRSFSSSMWSTTPRIWARSPSSGTEFFLKNQGKFHFPTGGWKGFSPIQPPRHCQSSPCPLY